MDIKDCGLRCRFRLVFAGILIVTGEPFSCSATRAALLARHAAARTSASLAKKKGSYRTLRNRSVFDPSGGWLPAPIGFLQPLLLNFNSGDNPGICHTGQLHNDLAAAVGGGGKALSNGFVHPTRGIADIEV